MEQTYDKAFVLAYMDGIQRIGVTFRRSREECENQYLSCQRAYSRLTSEIEQILHSTFNAMEAAESQVRAANAAYETAMRSVRNAEDENAKEAAQKQAQKAATQQVAAQAEASEASRRYEQAQKKRKDLDRVWSMHAPEVNAAYRQVEDAYSSFSHLKTDGNRDLQLHMGLMEKAESVLYEISVAPRAGAPSVYASATPTVSGSAAAPVAGVVLPNNTHRKNSMSAVCMDSAGNKTVTMRIGGELCRFPCTMSGMARAHRQATRCRDAEMTERISAMFEIENIREDLELGSGQTGIVQLGGYHRDVKTQGPIGYESHHIPARSVQDADAMWLPSVSISHEDHKKTSSYSGKQRHVYHSVFPDSVPAVSYKESIAQNLKSGSAGYISAVRNELLDLRIQTGHKYDGGISAYLDAVLDMLATRGIPGAKG